MVETKPTKATIETILNLPNISKEGFPFQIVCQWRAEVGSEDADISSLKIIVIDSTTGQAFTYEPNKPVAYPEDESAKTRLITLAQLILDQEQAIQDIICQDLSVKEKTDQITGLLS